MKNKFLNIDNQKLTFPYKFTSQPSLTGKLLWFKQETNHLPIIDDRDLLKIIKETFKKFTS